MSSTTKPVEQKARELLASEYARGGFSDFGDAEGSYMAQCALRAIIASLNTDGAEQIAENANCSGTDGERIRREAFEEAARIADEEANNAADPFGDNRWESGAYHQAKSIAALIRSLSTPSKGVG